MTLVANNGLSGSRRAVIMRAAVMLAAVVALSSFTQRVAAQQSQEKRDDLDVTMQIIVDPDAKLPDEVVRRIPLPVRKSAEAPPAATGDKSGQSDKNTDKTETTGSGKERDNAASEHGKEASQAAHDRAREAAEQREAARRAEAEERKKRERGPPDDRPDPPNRPPHN
jgi:hypothetical protein